MPTPGFKVLRRQLVVERTFTWLVRRRRLVCGYEHRIDISEAIIHVALGTILIVGIAH